MRVEVDSEDEHQAIRTNKARADKNRKGADIPGDRYRPRIFLNRSYNDSDYINATNIDSFKNKNHFIMAQTPLTSTVHDFLCLVYQEECSSIVSLEIASDSDKDVGHYLPCENQSLKEGCFTVKCIKSETRQYYILKTLHIRSAGKQRPGEKTVYHYQYKEWKTRDRVPTNAGNFVQFVKDVHASLATTRNSENRSPILVHCLNGAKRSGLFCVVAVLLEKIQMQYQVSVANTIRQIRSRRKSAIPNKVYVDDASSPHCLHHYGMLKSDKQQDVQPREEQLEFCHGCVSAHLELYNTYSNFHT